MASQKSVLRSQCFAVLLLFAPPCAATLSCPGGAETCQDEASMLQVNVSERTRLVVVPKDIRMHEELVPPPRESLTFSSLIWNNTMTRLVQKEITLTEAKAPEVNKVLYVFFAMFLGCCGCDRCFMGQTCLGFFKGLTMGGFWIWYLIDYFTCIYSALTKMETIHMMGYHAKFYPSTVDTAFWLMFVLLLLQLCQHLRQVKHHRRQMEQQEELCKQLDQLDATTENLAGWSVPIHHQALAHVSIPLSKSLRKVGVLHQDPSIPEIIAAFESIDLDGDGKLDRGELKQALSSMGLSDKDVDAMIQEADTDGDGKISKGEFLLYHAKKASKN